jgi:hypothetical protein
MVTLKRPSFGEAVAGHFSHLLDPSMVLEHFSKSKLYRVIDSYYNISLAAPIVLKKIKTIYKFFPGKSFYR